MSTDLLLELPSEAHIIVKENPFIEHHSLIRCGSYTSEWVAKSLGIEGPSTNDLLEAPSWHDYLRPVLPLTILELLKERQLESTSYRVDSYKTDAQKIDWIKREIVAHKKPLLLLIKAAKLHWVVVTGYNDARQVFYVYDPSFGKTSINTDMAIGNLEVSYTRLLNEWSGSWIFKYIAILILNNLLPQNEIADPENKNTTPDETTDKENASTDTSVENTDRQKKEELDYLEL